jgi:two-component system sensor histidine kinase UhpB
MLIEEALHESNEFLERLFNYANAPIVVWDDQFIITRFNPAFEALIGKMAKDVIGKPIEILFPPEKIEDSMKLIQTAQAGEDLENKAMDILNSDGSVRTVLLNSASVPGLEEKSIATIAQGLDITERIKMEDALRKSRKEFQTYFDSNTVGLSVTGADRSWIEVNQQLCEMLGYTKAELIDHNWLQLTHPEDIPYNLKLFNQALDGEIDNYQIDKRFFRKDGSIIYIALSAVCLRNDDGSVHHFLSSYNDITHRKLAEEVILKSEEKLRALNARLESVREEERINLSRELHDHLGQNLTGLKMEISYFFKKMEAKEAIDTDDFLVKAVDMLQLIDGMINNVRKISAGLRPNVLDYLGLIPAIEWQIEELTNRTEIDCEIKSDVAKIDLGVTINSSIFRIVQEAFTNIIRHSDATKVVVSIKEENDLFKLEILDNGVGIDEEKISIVKSLGVIGMKERTLQFNGKLHLENAPQGGTLLTLLIPKVVN